MFDGPSTLVRMALATSKIRVGTLVSSMYFRSLVTLDQAALLYFCGGVRKLSAGRCHSLSST